MTQLLIIGIDPGTTVGYAILDLNGNLIEKGSKKEFSSDQLISRLITFGKPLIIGTDKEKIPSYIEKIRARLQLVVKSPKKDLLIVEKQVYKDIDFKNDHERDAYAGAYYAYKKTRSIIERIRRYVRASQQNQVIEKVIKNKRSIQSALELLKKQRKPTKQNTPLRAIESIDPRTEKLKLTIAGLRKENAEYKNKLKLLDQKLKDVEFQKDRYQKMSEQQLTDTRAKKILNYRAERLDSMTQKIKKIKNRNTRLQKKLRKAMDFILKIPNHILVKNLENLGTEEFELKRNKLGIRKGDVLFVKNPTIVAQKTIEELKKDVTYILTPKITKSLDRYFVQLSVKDLKMEPFGGYFIIQKITFQRLVKDADKGQLLQSIVTEYKDIRNNEIKKR